MNIYKFDEAAEVTEDDDADLETDEDLEEGEEEEDATSDTE